MMKNWTVLAAIAALALAAPSVHAQEAAGPQGVPPGLGPALQAMSAEQLGTLTVGDLVKLAERISVSRQEARYVQRARVASRFVPGAGQFLTGDTLGGALFLGGDIALVAGTLIGAYLLLPANVQFSSVNYLDDPITSIRSRWEANSISSYLPSFGVCVGGMILKHILGHFASVEAAKSARRNIADGKVTFTPSLDFLGGPGFGLRMQY
jgi:hypothetical protein